jgi:DNA (cytosine-5)-methyltransferase 1
VETKFFLPRKIINLIHDLFAGIGGFRMVLQKSRGKCVFTSEWEKCKTYRANLEKFMT